MKASLTLSVRSKVAVAASAIVMLASTSMPSFADASPPQPRVQLAQTELRMGNQNTQRCLSACDQRAQTCYRNAKGRAKEDCENYGMTCKNNCR